MDGVIYETTFSIGQAGASIGMLERAGLPIGPFDSLNYYQFYAHEFWRFVYTQDVIEKYSQSFIEFPPMQKGASFNMENIKEQVINAIRRNQGS